MKKSILLLALLILDACTKEDNLFSDDSEDCPCRTVQPPELTATFTYRFCPNPPVEGFYEKFENTYHSYNWWDQWEKENPCD